MSKRRLSLMPHEGEIIGDYRVGGTLGQGAFGKVKLCIKIGDATKTQVENSNFLLSFSLLLMNGLDDVERIYRESAILTSLKHPNIIQLYQVVDSSEWVMIIMEYAKGGELLDYIRKKPNNVLTELEAVIIMHSIVAGLEYCHRRKVIHRDLKVENILLDSKENIKIADFGLSNTVHFGEKISTSCGTPSYIAPEVVRFQTHFYNCFCCLLHFFVLCCFFNFHIKKIRREEEQTPACDIWSLGVILYVMICGFLPFESDNLNHLYKKILEAQYTLPDYISDEAKLLIKRMLTLDPAKRINISEIRTHPWTTMEETGIWKKIGCNRPSEEAISEALKNNIAKTSRNSHNNEVNANNKIKSDCNDSDKQGNVVESPTHANTLGLEQILGGHNETTQQPPPNVTDNSDDNGLAQKGDISFSEADPTLELELNKACCQNKRPSDHTVPVTNGQEALNNNTHQIQGIKTKIETTTKDYTISKASSLSPKKERNREALNKLKNKLNKIKLGRSWTRRKMTPESNKDSGACQMEDSQGNLCEEGNNAKKRDFQSKNTGKKNIYNSKKNCKNKYSKQAQDSVPPKYDSPIVNAILKRNSIDDSFFHSAWKLSLLCHIQKCKKLFKLKSFLSTIDLFLNVERAFCFKN
ncbi:hypothetical protein RFI_05416 [Reticulomyxa filosa]|uniref:Protein kinase domain-containing protein n=1 Tax=Reticulomyxa filosa TaxID=46433 RepID=X6P0P3_RETFI|nr:hypothetical protein RFI_05416 [Reticulomyxa filosa]|eukprot:ETO31703.1 hypothetical protein RFI_05416 [Reticulomyxa filosa]